MKNLKVTTATGGIYIIHEATAFGTDAVIGHVGDGKLRPFKFEETDTVTEI